MAFACVGTVCHRMRMDSSRSTCHRLGFGSGSGSPSSEDERLEDHPIECQTKHECSDPLGWGGTIGRDGERESDGCNTATDKESHQKERADRRQEVAARSLDPTLDLGALVRLSCLLMVKTMAKVR